MVHDGAAELHWYVKNIDLKRSMEKLTKHAEKLASATNLVDEKQARLDLQNRVSKSKQAQTVDYSDKEKYVHEHLAVSRFTSASLLVGAAAEKISEPKKISVIEKLIKLGDLIVTDILTICSQFDFDQAVDEVLQSIIEQNLIPTDAEFESEDLRDFVELIVSEWEYRKATFPLLFIISVLSESGRTNVLLSSIKKAGTKTKLQKFIRETWAFDMSPETETETPRSLSKMMTRDVFLRLAFATFGINRSYWYHGKKRSKQAIASAVDVILKPLALKSGVSQKD